MEPDRTTRQRLRSVPATVWLIVALHLVITLCQTAVFPNIRSPDELQQVDLIVQVNRGEALPWPRPGQSQIDDATWSGAHMRADRLSGPAHLADRTDVPQRGQRQSLNDARSDGSWVEDENFQRSGTNQLVQHPPLYYVAAASALKLVPDWLNMPFDQVWLLLRWWNALVTAALPLLMWAIARRLALPEPLPVAAALIPLAIPELTHLESAVNNDNLLIILGAFGTYLVARILTGDLSRRTGLIIGGVTSLMLLTKGFALTMPLFVAMAYAAAGIRHRRKLSAFWALTVAGVASIPGALWWAANYFRYGTLQPNGYHGKQPVLPREFGWGDGGPDWLSSFHERMVTLFFVQDHAGLRQMDASWWMARVALALVVLGMLVTLVRATLPRIYLPVLILPTVAIAGIVASGSWAQFAANHALSAGQQGRYLYLGMPALMTLALAGAAVLPPAALPRVPLMLLGLAAAMQVAFQYNTWRLYWVPADGSNLHQALEAARAIGHWYPFSAAVPLCLAISAVALGTVVLLRLARLPEARTA